MKNEQIKVKCIGMDEEGKGIIKIKGREIHVPDLLDGETAVVELFQRKNSIDAKVVKLEERSEYREDPKCPYYMQCGGCQLQHMSYEGQIKFKQSLVEKLFKDYHNVNPILSMKEPYNYRNKVHAVLASSRNRQIISGIYQENTHKVVPIDSCMIEDSLADEIILTIRDLMKSFKMKPYDEDMQQGFLRHILIKRGFKTNQVMVVLVASSAVFPDKNNFIKELLKKHPEITTIVMNINNKRTSAVLGNTEKIIYGKGYIEDILCGCKFQISAKSFYQINPIQTEILYNKAMEMAKLDKNETVLDAYCGIGTISLIAAQKAKSVIGVELNKDAVKDAIKNAKLNNTTNIYFYNDDAGDFMLKLADQKQKIDAVIMDPPRSGSDEKFLSSVARLSPRKVIYISCNPVTQLRDVKYLAKFGYNVKAVQPVDMFPWTAHVESIVLMTKCGSEEK